MTGVWSDTLTHAATHYLKNLSFGSGRCVEKKKEMWVMGEDYKGCLAAAAQIFASTALILAVRLCDSLMDR